MPALLSAGALTQGAGTGTLHGEYRHAITFEPDGLPHGRIAAPLDGAMDHVHPVGIAAKWTDALWGDPPHGTRRLCEGPHGALANA